MGFGKLLGIAAICVGIYFAGDFALKKTDKFMKTHKSYSRVEPAYGFFNISECKHEKDIKEYGDSLERIPDQLQDIVNDYHGRVYFYEIEENPKKVGVYQFFDPVRGLEKGMFVSCINEDKTKSNTALHEYGHAIDEFAGTEFFGQKLSEIDNVKRMCAQYSSKLDNYFHTPIEFFAKMTEEYYRTKESRKNMKKEFPEMFEFYRQLEKKAVKRGITSKRNLASEALFDLLLVKTGIAQKLMGTGK
jgi:alkylhydroperoxidase/carboxymuconolactone decarboxylase family protein YurZ